MEKLCQKTKSYPSVEEMFTIIKNYPINNIIIGDDNDYYTIYISGSSNLSERKQIPENSDELKYKIIELENLINHKEN